MYRFLISGTIVLSLLRGSLSLHAQPMAARGDLRLMWYNTENLFHPDNAPHEGDDEFTPEGARRWTHERYRKKLTRLARVIIATGQWEPPGVVGLAEVENARVLEDLVSHPILEPFGYSYLHHEGPDHRGMDVACLVRDEHFSVAGWEAIPPVRFETFGDTREVLHLWGRWGRRDTLDIFLVHLISKYRGSGATAGYRKMQAARLVHLADSVQRIRHHSLIVLAGDFNEPWEGYSMEPLRLARIGGDSIVNILGEDGGRSYKYRGNWSGIDLFLVARGVERYLVRGSVFRLPALLTTDEPYGGEKPFRVYDGFRYTGGFSDHLPVLLDISRPLFSAGSGR